MSAEEGIIWGKFLVAFGSNYLRFDYDLRVGNGITPIENIPTIFKQDYEDLTKKRIDAVGYNNNIATIFEVKQRSGLSAIGQLLGYRDLFIKSFSQFTVNKLILVCGSASPEDQEIIKKNGIGILIFT